VLSCHMDPVQYFQPRTFSIKLWPPSESTRLMLVERMTKNPVVFAWSQSVVFCTDFAESFLLGTIAN